jgi:phosphinothricin acetyltransferase
VDARPTRDGDAVAVQAIYQAGMDTGDASFDSVAPSWDQFSSGPADPTTASSRSTR